MNDKFNKLKEITKIVESFHDIIEQFKITVDDNAHQILLEQAYQETADLLTNLNYEKKSKSKTKKGDLRLQISAEISKDKIDSKQDSDEALQRELNSTLVTYTDTEILEFANKYEHILILFQNIINLLNYDLKYSNLLLSNNSAEALQKKMTLLINQISKIEPMKFPKIKIDNSEIIETYHKFPHTLKLILHSVNDNLIIERIKQENIISQYNDKLDTEPYQNLIQHYSLYRLKEPVPFAEFIAEKFAMKNVKISDIGKIAKKHGSILVFNESTNINYRTFMLDKLDPQINGVSRDFIEKTDFIVRCENQPNTSLVLYRKNGEVIDIIKLRQKNATSSDKTKCLNLADELARETKLVIDTIDNRNFCEMNFDTLHLFHLYYMPNHINTIINNEIETSIMKHYQGPRDLDISNIAGRPIEHIRNEVRLALLKFFDRQKIKSIDQMDDFIHHEEISDIFINVMLESLSNSRATQGVAKLVVQECAMSMLSDITRRCSKFRQNFNEFYGKERKGLDIKKIRDAYERILVDALKTTITEKDNVYKIIEEKKLLFI